VVFLLWSFVIIASYLTFPDFNVAYQLTSSECRSEHPNNTACTILNEKYSDYNVVLTNISKNNWFIWTYFDFYHDAKEDKMINIIGQIYTIMTNDLGSINNTQEKYDVDRTINCYKGIKKCKRLYLFTKFDISFKFYVIKFHLNDIKETLTTKGIFKGEIFASYVTGDYTDRHILNSYWLFCISIVLSVY